MLDAQRRMVAKQLKGGEIVQQTPDGKVSVSGQVAVMSINALLCKVIFDKNPHHEFYIEGKFSTGLDVSLSSRRLESS
jgi:hypothetical protein